jgi:hypothetical protein
MRNADVKEELKINNRTKEIPDYGSKYCQCGKRTEENGLNMKRLKRAILTKVVNDLA